MHMWSTIDLTWIHLFHYSHGEEHTTTHDVIWDSFTSVARDVKFHVLCKQIHVFLTQFLQSLW